MNSLLQNIVPGLIANLLSDGAKAAFKALFPENLNREMEKAYNNAVDQWTKNDKERTLASIQQPEKIKQLQDAFEHPEKWGKLPDSTKELLQLFESELRKADLTRHYLDSEQHRAMMNVGLENGYKLDEILKLLKGYVSQQKHISSPTLRHLLMKRRSFIVKRMSKQLKPSCNSTEAFCW